MSAPDGAAGAAPAEALPPARGRRALFVAAAAAVVLAALVAVLAGSDSSADKLADSPLLGRAAPPVSGPSLLDGEAFDLEDHQGRFVLVNFFATWCVPCRQEHPELLRFSRAHPDDAVVVSVVFSDTPGDVRRFFAYHGGDWPVIDDTDGRVALDYGVAGVPESYLVGPDGVVRAKIVGGVDDGRLDEVLARSSGR